MQSITASHSSHAVWLADAPYWTDHAGELQSNVNSPRGQINYESWIFPSKPAQSCALWPDLRNEPPGPKLDRPSDFCRDKSRRSIEPGHRTYQGSAPGLEHGVGICSCRPQQSCKSEGVVGSRSHAGLC